MQSGKATQNSIFLIAQVYAVSTKYPITKFKKTTKTVKTTRKYTDREIKILG